MLNNGLLIVMLFGTVFLASSEQRKIVLMKRSRPSLSDSKGMHRGHEYLREDDCLLYLML